MNETITPNNSISNNMNTILSSNNSNNFSIISSLEMSGNCSSNISDWEELAIECKKQHDSHMNAVYFRLIIHCLNERKKLTPFDVFARNF